MDHNLLRKMLIRATKSEATIDTLKTMSAEEYPEGLDPRAQL